MKATGTVMDLQTRDVNTARGPAKSFRVNVDGKWYSNGFKAPACAVGDVVEVEYEMNGAFMNASKITKAAAGGATPTPVAVAPSKSAAPFGASRAPFPVPALHSDRAIIRQNALQHASRIVATLSGPSKAWALDAVADTVIQLARRFEAYATGDEDVNAVERDIARDEVEPMTAKEA